MSTSSAAAWMTVQPSRLSDDAIGIATWQGRLVKHGNDSQAIGLVPESGRNDMIWVRASRSRLGNNSMTINEGWVLKRRASGGEHAGSTRRSVSTRCAGRRSIASRCRVSLSFSSSAFENISRAVGKASRYVRDSPLATLTSTLRRGTEGCGLEYNARPAAHAYKTCAAEMSNVIAGHRDHADVDFGRAG